MDTTKAITDYVSLLQQKIKYYEYILDTISNYNKNSKHGPGICDYGCDCPNIAKEALKERFYE